MRKSYSRIFLCGAHSVGKTTLLRRLTEEPVFQGFRLETELARQVIAEQKLERNDFDHNKHPDVFERLQADILTRQNAVDVMNSEMGLAYIMDRGIDPLVYARYYLGDDAYQRLRLLPCTIRTIETYRSTSSLLFVVTPHPECIEDDGVRISPKIEDLREFTHHMTDTLKENEINFITIKALDLEERVKVVIDTMDTAVSPDT